MEPIILELERESNDLLIIAHESVLRVLYGYLMARNAADIPFLSFPRDEIIEVSILDQIHNKQCSDGFEKIIPASYRNKMRRIHIPNLPSEILQDSLTKPAAPADDVSISLRSGDVRQKGGTLMNGIPSTKEPENISQDHVEDVD